MPHSYFGGAWKCKINIANEMLAGEARRISPGEFGKRVADRLENAPCRDKKLKRIEIDFRNLDDYAGSSWDEVDQILNDLYDWADDERVWIESVTRRKR